MSFGIDFGNVDSDTTAIVQIRDTTNTTAGSWNAFTAPFPRIYHQAFPTQFNEISETVTAPTTVQTFRTLRVESQQQLDQLQRQLNTDTSYTTWTASAGGSWDVSDTPQSKILRALTTLFEKIPKELRKDMTEDDKKLERAKERSERLLKSWLSPKEYQGLINKGEIEIPSEFDEDTIFIVKRCPDEMVEIRNKKGDRKGKMCVVAEDKSYPVGDQLLSKILLLKTDEKKFKEVAVKYDV